jgi:hypothetical protein
MQITYIYRIELQQSSRIEAIQTVEKLRPVLMVLVGISAIILIPLGIWNSFGQTIALLCLTLTMLVFMCIMIILSLYYGFRLMKLMKTVFGLTKNTTYKIFLQKVRYKYNIYN